jgi:hypothetical protein
MKLKSRMRVTAALAALIALGGCGGGGGSGGPPAPGGLASGSNDFSISMLQVAVTADPAGTMPSSFLPVSLKAAPTTQYYSGYAVTGPAVSGVAIQFDSTLTNGVLKGSVQLSYLSPALMGSGTYTSTVVVKVCTDSNCTHQVSGSPQSISVTYTVTGTAIAAGTFALFPTSLNLESASSDAAVTATVVLTAYDLPTYGAYVRFHPESTTLVPNIGFDAKTYPNFYGSGKLSVNLALPATLGPGVYHDNITLEVCYDSACAKEANGSPWKIPLVYTVTASAGREFRQRIVPTPGATTMAGDPMGTALYVGTADANAAVPYKLLKLDPVSGSIVASVALPGAPLRLAVSKDGKYVYAGTESVLDDHTVTRVDAGSMTIDLSIPLPSIGFQFGTMDVSPANSHTMALAYDYIDPTAGSFRKITVFDDAVARPKEYSIAADTIYTDSVQWSTDGASLFVREKDIGVSGVTAAGLGPVATVLATAYGDGFAGAALHLDNGLLYSDAGGVLDPSTGVVRGRFDIRTPSSQGVGIGAALLTDTTTKRTFIAFEDSTPAAIAYTVESFDATGFTPLWIARFPDPLTSPALWGANGLAFLSYGVSQSVYLIDGSFVAP